MTDYTIDDVIFLPFTTRAFATGVPTVFTGTPTVEVWENAAAQVIVEGASKLVLTIDLNSLVGLNMATVTLSAANGFEAGKHYSLIIKTGTVGGVDVFGEVVGTFTIAWAAAAVDLANGTDGLTAIKAETVLILADTDEIGTAGVGLSNIGTIGTCTTVTNAVTLPTIPSNWITAAGINAAAMDGKGDWNIDKTGYALTTADWNVGKTGYRLSATGVDDIWDELMAGHVTADTAGLVLNEWQDGGRLDAIIDALQGDLDTLTDARTEPAQGAPPLSATTNVKVDWIYKMLRNKKTSTASLISIFNDDAATVDHKRTISDDGTTFTEGELETGP